MGYAGNEDVLPLNPVKVIVVGAALKKAGYRGPKKYITAMKQLSARAILGTLSWHRLSIGII